MEIKPILTIKQKCRECEDIIQVGGFIDEIKLELKAHQKSKQCTGEQEIKIYALRGFEKKLKILVACEESQRVCIAFRKLGHEAYSCDVLPCSGGHPEWHLLQNVTLLLKKKWDLIIAFPPCTDLCVSGAKHFERKRKDGSQQKSIDFFMLFANADCEHIVIENPIGIMSSLWRKPDQIIQPWMFGHGETKATCLWLKGLPKLKPTNIVPGREARVHKMPPSKDRWKERSRTYSGIAKAMAEQWGGYIIPKEYEPYEIKKVSEITFELYNQFKHDNISLEIWLKWTKKRKEYNLKEDDKVVITNAQ